MEYAPRFADGEGTPLAAFVESANCSEVNLIEPLLDKCLHAELPERVIYDGAADSDPLRSRLAERGVELICPHRRNRVKPPTQDGRSFRRYRRRWKIERSISWLQNFRRLVTRYEYYSQMFEAFVSVACIVILLRRL